MVDRTAVMICGHGSRDAAAIVEFDEFAAGLRRRLSDYDLEWGYLEFARPTIGDGLEALGERGAKRIVCVPCILFAAGHVKNDLPCEIDRFTAQNPGIEVAFARDLAVDHRLLDVAVDRIEEAESGAPGTVTRERSLLVVVGRGTKDPDANSNVAKVTRMLREGMGFGWAETGFAGVTEPLASTVLAHAAGLGYERIVVFPYFLFTGVLVKRVYAWVEEAAAAYPGIEVIKAGYIGNHPLLAECLAERVGEVLSGGNVMNCHLCKYRRRIVGYAGEQSAPAEGGPGQDHHHRHGHERRDGT